MSHIKFEGITKSYDNNSPVIQNLDLDIQKGSFTVLLGASGCGKSTILRMIAGLEKKTAGKIYIDNKDMEDVQPGDRNIAMVFQNYALYPTMTVYKNIEFGLKNMKVPTEERKKRVKEIADSVGLTEYLSRKPHKLSGGQRQRVALARAIVKKPKVFLMDEPLSNLDAKLRTQIRTDLIELYRNLDTTFVYVTHDQVEAMSMGTQVILLKSGEIQQIGTPTEIYQKPANLYTARFIGSPPMNIIESAPIHNDGKKNYASLGFRPEKVHMYDENVSENDLVMEGEILAREILGDQILYKIKIQDGENIQIKTFNKESFDYGKIKFYIKKKDLCYFDVHGKRIDVDSEVPYANN